MAITIAVTKEPGESRVALVPAVVKRLTASGDSIVRMERGAGQRAGHADQDYADAGAVLVEQGAHRDADLVLQVAAPTAGVVAELREGSILVGFLNPLDALLQALCARRITAIAMERIPRSSRAQAMDALSSQRSIAGYRAVLIAASRYGRFLPMLTVPTGTVRPATLLVIGAGVSGLQAIATARRLGAIVEATDVRPESREQVESLGGRFLSAEIEAGAAGGYARELSDTERAAQQQLLARHVAHANLIITTAEIPGRTAPRIVSAAMVESMASGSVLVDLAAASGGNCELTRPGEEHEHQGVRICGPRNAAAEMPAQASELYALNLQHLLGLLIKDGAVAPDWQDDILAAACVCRDGEEST